MNFRNRLDRTFSFVNELDDVVTVFGLDRLGVDIVLA